MKKKTVYAILAVLLIAGAVGVVLWQSHQRSAQGPETLRSAVVERGEMLVVVSASGHVRPASRAHLSFAAGGQVAEVLVDVGDEVGPGDVLARLDTARLNLEVERARANVRSAETQLEKLRAGAHAADIESARANLRAAEAQLSAAAAERDRMTAGPREAQIAAGEAEFAAALTQQKKAADFYETTLTCFTVEIAKGEPIELPDGQVIPAPEDIEREICPLLGMPEEQARHRLAAANKTLAAAEARLQEIEAGPTQNQAQAAQAGVNAAAARRDAAEAQLDLLLAGATAGQIAAAEAGVDQARFQLDQAELALGHAALKAPFGGTVAAVDIQVGAQASPGLPVVILVDESSYRVRVAVDEIEVAGLTTGQAVELTFDALPETVVPGTVRRISAAASPEPGVVTYAVEIDLSSTDAPLRVDMTSTALVIVEELRDVLKIPTWAVRVDRNTGQQYVHRLIQGEVERVDVTLGVRHDGVTQVVDGLSAGDTVVRVPDPSLFDFGGS